MNEDSPICWYTVFFQIHGAVSGIDTDIADANEGAFDEDGDLALYVGLEHIVSHLCRAWNSREIEWGESDEVPQEEWERQGYSIPLWDERFRLIKMWDLEPRLNEQADDVSRETLDYFLRKAKTILEEFNNSLHCSDSDVFDCSASNASEQSLQAALAGAIKNVCLAWHLRFVPLADIGTIANADIEKISCSIPSWNFDFCLIEIT